MGKIKTTGLRVFMLLSLGLLTSCIDFGVECNFAPVLDTYKVQLERRVLSDTLHVGDTLWLEGLMRNPELNSWYLVDERIPYAPNFIFSLTELAPRPTDSLMQFVNSKYPFILHGWRGASRYSSPSTPDFLAIMDGEYIRFSFGFEPVRAGIFKIAYANEYGGSGKVLVDQKTSDCSGKFVFELFLPFQSQTAFINRYPHLGWRDGREYVLVVLP